MLWRQLVGVADHAEQAFRLGHAVNRELGVEDFVAAVLAVGLGEHHQFHVAGVALQRGEGVDQVVDLVLGQGQAELGVGCKQRGPATAEYIYLGQRRGFQRGEQFLGLAAVQHGALGHTVVQQIGDLGQLFGRQPVFTQQWLLHGQAVFDETLYPAHRQAAVVGNVGGLGSPG